MSDPSCSAALSVVLTVLTVVVGCSPSSEAPAAKSAIRRIDPNGLVELGEYTPPLDGGRIEIAGPAGWELGSRTKGYVVRFLGSSDDPYPMILVKAGDASVALTTENLVAFASDVTPDGTGQPVLIGQRPGVLQLKRGKAPNTIDQILEQLIFTTVIGDRSYMLELRVRQGRIDDYQDLFFAVIAGMREADAESVAAIPGAEEVGKPGDEAGQTEEDRATEDAGRKELEEIFE